MNDAELHTALREVVAIGRRGGYDNDEIAEKLAPVARDCAVPCTPTQALDIVERTLIGRRGRIVGVISLEMYRHLTEIVDDLSENGRQDLADELSRLRRDASRGICTHCGSYDLCPCDDMADQQSTGGY